jgi:hypothetical protein
MTDDEIAAIAAATKALFDQRDLTMRTELASMRATVEALETEVRDLRAIVAALPAETHSATMRLVSTLGASLGNALPSAVQAAAERTFERMVTTRAAELEQRAMTGAAQ